MPVGRDRRSPRILRPLAKGLVFPGPRVHPRDVNVEKLPTGRFGHSGELNGLGCAGGC